MSTKYETSTKVKTSKITNTQSSLIISTKTKTLKLSIISTVILPTTVTDLMTVTATQTSTLLETKTKIKTRTVANTLTNYHTVILTMTKEPMNSREAVYSNGVWWYTATVTETSTSTTLTTFTYESTFSKTTLSSTRRYFTSTIQQIITITKTVPTPTITRTIPTTVTSLYVKTTTKVKTSIETDRSTTTATSTEIIPTEVTCVTTVIRTSTNAGILSKLDTRYYVPDFHENVVGSIVPTQVNSIIMTDSPTLNVAGESRHSKSSMFSRIRQCSEEI